MVFIPITSVLRVLLSLLADLLCNYISRFSFFDLFFDTRYLGFTRFGYGRTEGHKWLALRWSVVRGIFIAAWSCPDDTTDEEMRLMTNWSLAVCEAGILIWCPEPVKGVVVLIEDYVCRYRFPDRIFRYINLQNYDGRTSAPKGFVLRS